MNAFRMALTQLTDVLDKENEALRSLNLPAAARLLPDKQSALAQLEHFSLERAAISGADEMTRILVIRLRDATLENKSLLERGIGAQRHIMSLLALAARGTGQVTGYGSKGAYVGRPSTARAFAIVARA